MIRTRTHVSSRTDRRAFAPGHGNVTRSVTADGEIELTADLLRQRWPLATESEELGHNLWLVRHVHVSPEGTLMTPEAVAAVEKTAGVIAESEPRYRRYNATNASGCSDGRLEQRCSAADAGVSHCSRFSTSNRFHHRGVKIPHPAVQSPALYVSLSPRHSRT